jgi:hypothetical protein
MKNTVQAFDEKDLSQGVILCTAQIKHAKKIAAANPQHFL